MTALMAVRASIRISAAAGGPSTWLPSDLGASLVAWFDAKTASSITASSGAVSQWDDLSGNGYHATQSTAGAKPSSTSRSGWIGFDGSSDFLSLPSGVSFSSTSRCVAGVANPTSGETGHDALIGANGVNGYSFYLRHAVTGGERAGITKTNVSFFAQGPYSSADADQVFLGNLTSSTWRVSVNGTAVTGTHSQTFSSNLSGFIGKNVLGSTSYDFMYGSIGEIVIATEISQANQQKLEGYLAWRWGLEGNLPNDHPYKNGAP